MKSVLGVFFLLGLFLATTLAENVIVKAKLESCPGCSLNRLTEIKTFAYEDLPKYDVEFKKIHGAKPELVFFDKDDQEVERHPLSDLSREECNQLLQDKGFQQKKKEL